MLEIRNLIKKYKAKGGVVVTALNDVSLKFPETGMIFLLGKSGSGKSTLLNVVGGLDRPDSGEIIIKGKNSKTFSAADFDSYRNTYIGFIFQEYNILNEFNVEQNISLALQLQGKPNDKKTVDDLLAQVDLSGYGKRKPNTLSGGQKQRVAIARALIKNPEIIMADEPTGALDSNTGKQVFDTLKKLSQEKLVIVVSHDRDFAETYGDRIIELSDGKVISDVSKEFVEPVVVNDNVQVINDHTLSIKDGSKLKKEDMDVIYNILKKQNGEAIISSGERDLPAVKQAIRITDGSGSAVFNETQEVETKEYDPKQAKFIRSHLPFARAFKMGSSSLKTKPFRLIFTAFLTTVSLTMFGLTSTLMLFNENYSISRALMSSDRVSEFVQKQYKTTTVSYRYNRNTGKKEDSYSYDDYNLTMLSDEDVSSLNNNIEGLNFAGVYTFQNATVPQFNTDVPREYYMVNHPEGFVEINNDVLNKHQISVVAGTLPTKEDEVALPIYFYELAKGSFEGVNNYQAMIGKKISIALNGYLNNSISQYTVTGILNVGDIDEKYEVLKDSKDDTISVDERNERQSSLRDLLSVSYHTFIYVAPSVFYEKVYKPLVGEEEFYKNDHNYINPLYVNGLYVTYYTSDNVESDITANPDWFTTDVFPYEEMKDTLTSSLIFFDNDGNKIDLNDNFQEDEIYISRQEYQNYAYEVIYKYFNKCANLLDGANYDQQLFTLLSNNKTEMDYRETLERLRNNYFYDSYPDGYSKDEDEAKIKNLMDQYYVTVAKRQYAFDLAGTYITLHDSFGLQNTDAYIQFKDYYEAATSVSPYDLSHLTDIENFLKQDSFNLIKIAIMFKYRDIMNYTQEYDTFVQSVYNGQQVNDYILQAVEQQFNAAFPNIALSYDTSHINAGKDAITLKYFSYKGNSGSLKVVGYYVYKSGNDYGSKIMKQSFIEKYGMLQESYWRYETTTEYKPNGVGKYGGAIVKTTYSTGQINVMRRNHNTYMFGFSNAIYQSIAIFLQLINVLKTVFLVTGIVFGVFAALMLLNFIATSIAAKTKDIGILRAVGARGSDLFKIFFSESGLITIVCLVVAIIGSALGCFFLNQTMVKEVGVALLDYNLINIGIMALGAFLIAVAGTFFPVLRAALRPPVESIRTL